jgi:demethylmenaquinone methyltransferase / 2-methoxy-6-polyprenyl-1,4-benzoquinol methylase
MTEQEFEIYNQQLFKKVAPWYKWLDLVAKGCRKKFCKFMMPVKGKSILDVATGTGKQAIALVTCEANVTGVDLSSDMLHYARLNDKSGKIKFVHANGTSLPFEDGQFEITVMSFALHCMTAEVRSKTVDEMIRVTQKGGQIAYIDYCKPKKMAGRILYSIIKRMETPLYRKFLETDFNQLVTSKGVALIKHEKAYLGIVQLISFRC